MGLEFEEELDLEEWAWFLKLVRDRSETRCVAQCEVRALARLVERCAWQAMEDGVVDMYLDKQFEVLEEDIKDAPRRTAEASLKALHMGRMIYIEALNWHRFKASGTGTSNFEWKGWKSNQERIQQMQSESSSRDELPEPTWTR